MYRFLRYLKRIERSWLISWAFIYLAFMGLGAFFPDYFGVTLLKYIGITLTLIYAIQKFPKDHLLHIALAFTLLADTILVIDHTSIIGVFVFCFAQFFHITRFAGTAPKWLFGYGAIVLLIFTFGVFEEIPPIYVICFVYALSLGANIVLSRAWMRRTHSVFSYCAFAGFLLFAACDVCVASSYLSLTGAIPAFLYPFANYFAWAFYYPSQLLISNSSGLAKVPKSR